jgi:hypothetical protein
LGIVFIPFLMIGGFYTILFGGAKNIFLLVSALWKAHFQIEYSQYAVLFCSGPWYRYIIDYTLLSPLTMFLFIGYFFYLLFSREIEHNAFYFFMYFVAIFLGLVFLKHSKVVRFAINLDMILGLFSVLALYELFKQKDRHYQNCLVFIFCIATFFMNYFSFMDLFIAKGIYDPASYFLLKARGFIP